MSGIKTIRTSDYPIRYKSLKDEGIIIENKNQENRGGYELIHYYNTHGRGSVSAELCSYQREGYLVSVHAEMDREDIRDRKQVGFAEIYYNYEHAKKIIMEKIEYYEKWVVDKIIWRMTRKQYYQEVHPKAIKEYEKRVKTWERKPKEYQAINEILSPIKNKDFIINSFENVYMQEHKGIVLKAVEEGKNVPEEVKKEYGLEKK